MSFAVADFALLWQWARATTGQLRHVVLFNARLALVERLGDFIACIDGNPEKLQRLRDGRWPSGPAA